MVATAVPLSTVSKGHSGRVSLPSCLCATATVAPFQPEKLSGFLSICVMAVVSTTRNRPDRHQVPPNGNLHVRSAGNPENLKHRALVTVDVSVFFLAW